MVLTGYFYWIGDRPPFDFLMLSQIALWSFVCASVKSGAFSVPVSSVLVNVDVKLLFER